jgi:hypothetical protein
MGGNSVSGVFHFLFLHTKRMARINMARKNPIAMKYSIFYFLRRYDIPPSEWLKVYADERSLN